MENSLLPILRGICNEARNRLQQTESGQHKLYATGPGGASIDGTSEYLSALRRQLSELEAALVAAEHLQSDTKQPY
jgi:hypothetical protein